MSDDGDDDPPPMISGPITFPLNSGPQPRQSNNLQGLLRFAVEVGEPNASLTARIHHQMDPRSREFLQNALSQMTVNATEELRQSIAVLKRLGDLSVEECVEALDNITELVENMDVANDFHKVDGLSIIKPCLSCTESVVRMRAAQLIGELAQNNPVAQGRLLEAAILPLLLKILDDDDDDMCRVKALHAISCLVRSHEKGFISFREQDGFSALLRSLQRDSPKLNMKATFLLRNICGQDPTVKDELVAMGYVEQVTSQLATEDVQLRELSLGALSALVDNHNPAQRAARNPQLGLKAILKGILAEPECEEEDRDNAGNLLNVIFAESREDSCEQDR